MKGRIIRLDIKIASMTVINIFQFRLTDWISIILEQVYTQYTFINILILNLNLLLFQILFTLTECLVIVQLYLQKISFILNRIYNTLCTYIIDLVRMLWKFTRLKYCCTYQEEARGIRVSLLLSLRLRRIRALTANTIRIVFIFSLVMVSVVYFTLQ